MKMPLVIHWTAICLLISSLSGCQRNKAKNHVSQESRDLISPSEKSIHAQVSTKTLDSTTWDYPSIAQETGLPKATIQALHDLDDTLDPENSMVKQFTIKMLKRFYKSYTEIDQIYIQSGISQDNPIRVPPFEIILRPYRADFKRDTMQQIPDQLRKTNMVYSNCEKNMGAICGGILTVIGPQQPGSYCRHEGWEKINSESTAWAIKLKTYNPSPSEIEILKRVRTAIDKTLQMEFNYQTNSRDYHD